MVFGKPSYTIYLSIHMLLLEDISRDAGSLNSMHIDNRALVMIQQRRMFILRLTCLVQWSRRVFLLLLDTMVRGGASLESMHIDSKPPVPIEQQGLYQVALNPGCVLDSTCIDTYKRFDGPDEPGPAASQELDYRFRQFSDYVDRW